jgi:hypothetical protein
LDPMFHGWRAQFLSAMNRLHLLALQPLQCVHGLPLVSPIARTRLCSQDKPIAKASRPPH